MNHCVTQRVARRPMWRLRRWQGALWMAGCCAMGSLQAQGLNVALLSLDQLGDLSLEQLGNIQVTSVSRRVQPLLQAPASVFVITAEDIRRSGARSLPEVLRLAPNLHVARTSAAQWSISARGFNNGIGNKLLVLVDGRTVYSPLFSGVFWDAQDLMLEDVDQIEVISGPGATLWGANAVNGVINVTTRPARDTQGSLLALGAGDGGSQVSARHGGKLGDDAHYRVYAMNLNRHATSRANGTAFTDATRKKQLGWRAEWGRAGQGLTLQGDAYEGGSLPGTVEAPRLSGAHLLARWSRKAADGSGWHLQGYYDHRRRDNPFLFRDEMSVLDLEWQHSPALPRDHKLIWGAGYREARDEAGTTLLSTFIPLQKKLRWRNVFVQDSMALSERLAVTLGVKFESNVYTGWEFLPSARLAWTPSATELGWIALSRAVRAPARLDREFFFPGAAPFLIRGGPDFQSEVATVLELGWRAQATRDLSYSVTLFQHHYGRLRSGQPPPAVVQNLMAGRVSGLEAWAHWQVLRDWRLSGGLNTLHQHFWLKPGSTDPTGPSALGSDPREQWLLRSSHNLGARHELDVNIRHVGGLSYSRTPGYTAVDARWGWRVTPAVELSLTAQNLFDRAHVEYGDPATASQQRRSAWLKLLWRI
ncbi:MAG: TonB-dependent receptor [Ramlibacter sp.]|nr:TonB-dependent receptor [Ramlibacter sp.]